MPIVPPPSHEAAVSAFPYLNKSLPPPPPASPSNRKIETYSRFSNQKIRTYINFPKLKISTYNSQKPSGPPKYRVFSCMFSICFTILLLCFTHVLYYFLPVLLYFVQHLPTQPNRYKLPKFLPIYPKILPNRYNRYNPYFIIGLSLSTQNKHLQQFRKT